jgi:predicted nucleotidyltransferase
MILNQTDLDRVSRELVSLPAREAYLFGSQAQGTSGADSDVDLAVVTEGDAPAGDFQARLQRSVAVRRRLRRALPGVPIDVLVFSPAEWREFRLSQPIFSEAIVSRGKRLA